MYGRVVCDLIPLRGWVTDPPVHYPYLKVKLHMPLFAGLNS